ncbi:MAG: glycosyltransferase [Polyangiaceae bacterium]|nr:glycosyltransferase [Polyangiaceae bacterium]
MAPDVCVVLGTFNRLPLLQAAVSSIRRSVGVLEYRIVVVDGGSTDGTCEWLAIQPDVVPIFQKLPLTGAVKAFNLGFTYAVHAEARYCTILNDDDQLLGPSCEIERAVEMMEKDAHIGGVAFEANLRGEWQCECWRDQPSCGKGVVRRETLMAVARAQGDPEGCKFWSEEWETYAADSQAGCLIHKLGWVAVRGRGLRVDDKARNGGDDLRKNNVERYIKSGTAKLFTDRWSSPTSANYDRKFAERYGGRVH